MSIIFAGIFRLAAILRSKLRGNKAQWPFGHHSSPVRPVIRTGACACAVCLCNKTAASRCCGCMRKREMETAFVTFVFLRAVHTYACVCARARSFIVLLSVRFFLVTSATAVTERHRLIVFPSKASNDIFQWLVMPISFVRDFWLPNDRAPAIRWAENVTSPASFQKWSSNIHFFRIGPCSIF